MAPTLTKSKYAERDHPKENKMTPEPAVLDVLWGGNMELARRNQEVWPHAPYVVQS